jgi:glutathione-regulated potassium-efflux system protein KefB
MALGTFLAGVLLADSEYRHALESNIAPFEGLLLGLFFITVGMGVNLKLLALHPWIVLGLVALLLACKGPIVAAVGKANPRLDGRDALKLAALLAGGGEFAFVVFRLAAANGMLTRAQQELLVLVVTLAMAAVPLLVLAAARMPASRKPERAYDEIDADGPRVIIAGFGRVGQIIGRLLRRAAFRSWRWKTRSSRWTCRGVSPAPTSISAIPRERKSCARRRPARPRCSCWRPTIRPRMSAPRAWCAGCSRT